MSYRNERMMRGFRSLDALLNGRDPSKFPPLSDLESGARQIRRGTEEDDACADLPGEESPEAALDAAAWDEACADPTSEASPEAALDAAVWDEACAVRPPYQAMREEKLAQAKERLVANGLERLIPVLDQIVINGKYRQDSIRRLAMKRRIPKASAERFYDRGVNALLTFFSPNKIKGETHIVKSVCL
jgi:hypothetical protein